jgi:hypothetical protein
LGAIAGHKKWLPLNSRILNFNSRVLLLKLIKKKNKMGKSPDRFKLLTRFELESELGLKGSQRQLDFVLEGRSFIDINFWLLIEGLINLDLSTWIKY